MRGLWRRYLRLPRNVYAIGLVSFFNDASSEIIYPLLPIFLATALGASPVAIGLIEGALFFVARTGEESVLCRAPMGARRGSLRAEVISDPFPMICPETARGPVAIDAATRDIVQNEYAMEVIRKSDGKLGVKVLGTTSAVKDECKVLKLGRCGS